MTLETGTRLGPYEVLGLAGSGGMGEVYRARDTRLGRTVALKLTAASDSGDPQHRLRLEREARAIAALNHPHICAIYDVGHEAGRGSTGRSSPPSSNRAARSTGSTTRWSSRGSTSSASG